MPAFCFLVVIMRNLRYNRAVTILQCLRSDAPNAVRDACLVLETGGIVLYPTDTVYGLGVDATNADAIARLYALKNRPEDKAILIMVSGVEMAREYVEAGEKAQQLMEQFWPGKLSIVLPSKGNLPVNLLAGMDTIGVRQPNHPFCIELAKAYGSPITTTSANISGVDPARSINRILADFGDREGTIDLAIDDGELPDSLPSTVIGFEAGKPIIYREGAVTTEEIGRFL
jgi:L-threonylcarbamoyladenylate synthase